MTTTKNVKTIDDINADYTLLTKDILRELMPMEPFKTATKKPEMLEKLDEYLEKDPLLKRRILKDYPEQFAVHPIRMEEELDITKTERKRWEEQGKFKVAYYSSFNKYGQSFNVPMYTLQSLELSTPEVIEEWRNEHKEKVKENRKAAAKKAVATRKENKHIQKKFLEEEWKKVILEWHKQSPAMAATMELAHWLHWINRWAKYYQEKQFKAVKLQEKYKQRKEELYEIKNKTISLLSLSPYTSLSVYEPAENSGNVFGRMDLCDSHYHKWRHKREGYYHYYPKGEFIFDHYQDHISKCNECMTSIQEAVYYYTLVFLEVKNEDGKREFSFHTPLPIAQEGDLFGDINIDELPKVEHTEQEGMFRFGRSLEEEEIIVYREKVTMDKYQEALQKYMQYLNK